MSEHFPRISAGFLWVLRLALLIHAVLQPTAASAQAPAVPALAGEDAVVSAGTPRAAWRLAQGWRFLQDDEVADPEALSDSTQRWERVSVPHSWSTSVPAPRGELAAAGLPATGATARASVGWYRLDFEHPTAGNNHWLQFDGASLVADVWLNGQWLGQHKGAYTAFRYDVTRYLRPGRNALVVKTDNRPGTRLNAATAVIPMGGDFARHGGLYRDVWLISTTRRIHLSLADWGGPGVVPETARISPTEAAVRVRAKIDNLGESPGPYTLIGTISDETGQTVAQSIRTVSLAAGSRTELSLDLRVERPRLWQGTRDPYLYRLTVELRDAQGRALDRVGLPYGIRHVEFDPAQGFVLNGEPYALRGVGLHQDHPDRGWALQPADINRSLALALEMGANALRLTHYPHSSYTLQRAAELGFVVWAELPLLERVTPSGECAATAAVSPPVLANAGQQLREMIRQQTHQTSVAVWGLAHNLALGGACGGADAASTALRELQAQARLEDKTRLTTLADFNEDLPAWRTSLGLAPMTQGGITDTWALNRHYLWHYGRDPAALGQELDRLQAKYRRQPLAVGSFGAGAVLSQQTDNPLGGRVSDVDRSGGTRTLAQPEGYAAWVHEQLYPQLAKRPSLWGVFAGPLVDYGADSQRGSAPAYATGGLVSFDRSTPKDAFYFYKANWSRSPTTYVVGRRHTQRAYAITDIKVYSNAATTTLELNGLTVASLPAAQCPFKICVFNSVKLKAGANEVIAQGRSPGKPVVFDRVTWQLSPDNERNVRIAAGQLLSGLMNADGKRYGSDQFFVGGQGIPLTPDSYEALPFNTAVTDIPQPKDRPLWAAARVGQFSYDIPLPNGRYSVSLGFVEPLQQAAAGQRVFDVVAQGVVRLKDLDIVVAAGGPSKGLVGRFDVQITNGHLKLDFRPSAGEAIVSNLAIVAQGR